MTSLEGIELGSSDVQGSDLNRKKNKKSIKSIEEIKDEVGNVMFFIVNFKKSGFVIISGDKRIETVLAYSLENSLEKKNGKFQEGVRQWIEETSSGISYKVANNDFSDEEINYATSSFPCTIEEIIQGTCGNDGSNDCPLYEQHGPQLDSEWDQNCGFNQNLSNLSCGPCGKVYAGCVPIAFGQIMYHHQKPNNYNWSSMHFSGGGSSESALIEDIFNSFGSSISSTCYGTGVPLSFNYPSVFSSFGYYGVNYSNFNYSTAKAEIKSGYPIILVGTGTGGHMWIAEGLKRTTYCYGTTTSHFYMNWGWGGSNNGWFYYNGWSVNGFNFNSNKKMITNIR